MQTFSLFPQAIKTLTDLIGQPESEIEAMLKTVESLKPSSDHSKLFDDQLDAQTNNIIGGLITLAREQRGLADRPLTSSAYVEHIVKVVKESSERQGKASPSEFKTELLKKLLMQAFSAKFSLGGALKVRDLMTFNTHNFCRMRVVSDVRPVFESDEHIGDPVGAILVHSMNIVFQNRVTGSFDEFFVALDTGELREVQQCIERAIEKSELLEKALKSFGKNSPEEETSR